MRRQSGRATSARSDGGMGCGVGRGVGAGVGGVGGGVGCGVGYCVSGTRFPFVFFFFFSFFCRCCCCAVGAGVVGAAVAGGGVGAGVGWRWLHRTAMRGRPTHPLRPLPRILRTPRHAPALMRAGSTLRSTAASAALVRPT